MIAKCAMVIVLSADTGALIVAAIVTMLPFESPTIHYPPPCCFTASLFRLCIQRFDSSTRFRGSQQCCLSFLPLNIETDKQTKLQTWVSRTAAHWIRYFPSNTWKKYFKNRATICICEHGTGCLADAGLDPNSGGSDIQTMDRKVRR